MSLRLNTIYIDEINGDYNRVINSVSSGGGRYYTIIDNGWTFHVRLTGKLCKVNISVAKQSRWYSFDCCRLELVVEASPSTSSARLFVEVSSVDMPEKEITVTMDSSGRGSLLHGGLKEELQAIRESSLANYYRIQGTLEKIRKYCASGDSKSLLESDSWEEVSIILGENCVFFDRDDKTYIRLDDVFDLNSKNPMGYRLKKFNTYYIIVDRESVTYEDGSIGDLVDYCYAGDGRSSIVSKRLL